MTQKQPNEKDIRCYLWAFADGELDVQHNCDVLAKLKLDEAATKRVQHQQQLRKCVAKAMADPAKAPADLCASIMAMTQAAQLPERRMTIADALASPVRGVWRVAAVAAVVALAATAIFLIVMGQNLQSTPTRMAAVDTGAASIVPASMVERFSRRHIQCSQDPAALGPEDLFTENVHALPASISDFLGVQVTAKTLDLSVLGYELAAAGRCSIPGRGAAMVHYQASQTLGHPGYLSMWLKAYDGNPELPEGHIYAATDGQSAQSLLVWRRDQVVYYLMGSSDAPVEQAAFLLGGASSCTLPGS